MTMQANGVPALTEKEKQTLRLMVRGHDAKSIARSLDLSVHTINERLRDARRKLAVSSSREAARLLFEAEDAAAAPEKLGDALSGEAGQGAAAQDGAAPVDGAGRPSGRLLLTAGVLVMSLVFALLALAGTPEAARSPVQTPAEAPVVDAAVVDAARRFLTLVDAARWGDAYRATGSAFRKLNTLTVWTEVSERVRPPLGAVVSRTLLSQENLPAPPSGYEVVKFRTRFASKGEAVETVTLDREDGAWRVVGVTIG